LRATILAANSRPLGSSPNTSAVDRFTCRGRRRRSSARAPQVQWAPRHSCHGVIGHSR
jgi:hypothetical protein